MEQTPCKSDDHIKIYEVESNTDGTDSVIQFPSEGTPDSKIMTSEF